MLGFPFCAPCKGCLLFKCQLLYWQRAGHRLDFGTVICIGSSPALAVCKQSLPLPSDWFNKDLVSVGGQERKGGTSGKERLCGKNQMREHDTKVQGLRER